MKEEKIEKTKVKENMMRKIDVEKVVLSAGAVGDALDKAVKLLSIITGKKPLKTKAIKRIPTWGVRPKLEVGCKVTIRGEEAKKLLKRLLFAIDNQIKEGQVAENHFSFGIKEYIEIPDIEYQRDIGIIGFNITVDFIRKGARVKRKKIKKGRVPKKQMIAKEEIITYLKQNFEVEII